MKADKEVNAVERIYPLKEDVISRCRGMLVCVIYNNGFRHIGVLESCSNGWLVLDDSPFGFGRNRAYGDAVQESPVQPPSIEAPPKSRRSRKPKKAKAAGIIKTSQTPTNYAPHTDNPASADPQVNDAGTVKIPLNDIALLFLMI